MRKICKKFKVFGLLLMLAVAAVGVTSISQPMQVEAAAKKGWQKIDGKQYYILDSGAKAKGLQKIKGKTYYFDTKTGEQKKGWQTINGYRYYFGSGDLKKAAPESLYMATGWRKDGDGNRRYFTSSGRMATQWCTLDGKKYYFNPDTGIMRTGWLYLGEDKYYFNTKTGIMSADVMLKDTKKNITRYFNPSGRMARGWKTFSSEKKCYFNSDLKSDRDGAMVHGFKDIDGKTYYFLSTDGRKVTGWVTNKQTGAKYYLNPENGGIRVENTEMTISGKTYIFDKDGVATLKTEGPNTVKPTGTRTIKNYLAGALQPVGQALYVWAKRQNTPNREASGTRTIKNYLAGALQPVGQALYVWGGGWTDATRKGVSPLWKQWYDSQDSDYDYHNWNDLSAANRAKGLDCSGFVGWAAYQAMHSTSGEGYGYTVVSGDVGPSYRSRGWGSILTQASLASSNYKFQPGDIGYNSGHTWIVLGQCSDKSLVIVHSTPNAGCQISGTPTPDGTYNSQAIALAEQYMARYPGVSKYDYHESSGNYIRNGNYFRWNTNTLSDPEGYKNMTADQILADLFS